ncbi:MAG TPA: hypothetical protein DIW30_05805 [Bacteroidales bacterium]|nr:hypothetical protein [Bacteroidales bacterium]
MPFVLCLPCSAQVTEVIPGSPFVANTATARTDYWAAFHNPASLVQEERFGVALQYENKYLTGELSTELVQASFTNQYVNAGVAYSFFGYSKYSEMMAAVALARQFGRFSLGLQANLLCVYAGESVGYRCTAVPQIGAVVNITPAFALGFQTFNPFVQSLKLTETRRQLPAIYSLGFDYHFRPNMRWDVQADYDINNTFRVATGYEWRAVEQLTLKMGVYYQRYVVTCIGFGLHFAGFQTNVSAELHPVLGVNLLCHLSYAWK